MQSKAQERQQEKGEKLTPEKSEKVPGIGTKPQEKVFPNVYLVDDDMFAAGPYYNVRTGRKQMREGSELVMGDPSSMQMAERRKECGFNLNDHAPAYTANG